MRKIKNNDLLAKGKEIRNNLIINMLEKYIDSFLLFIVNSYIAVCHLYEDDEVLQQVFYDDGSEQVFRSQMNILRNSVNCKHFFDMLLSETYTNEEFIHYASKFDLDTHEADYSKFQFLLITLQYICETASKLDPNDTTLSILFKQKINDYVVNPIIAERTELKDITTFIKCYADYYGIFADLYIEQNNKWIKNTVVIKNGSVVATYYKKRE